MCLGLLVNALLIIGVNKWRRLLVSQHFRGGDLNVVHFFRWFLLHWLIFHLLLLIILFIVSVIFFSVEVRLRKLLGVVPVLASFFFMYCWSKVYELFCYISLLTDPLVSPFCEFHPPPPYCLPPAPYPGLRQHSEEAQHEDEEEVGEQGMGGLGTEFYPVDPLSRGMMDRLVALNRNMYGSTYVPFHNDDDYVSQVKDYDKFVVNFSFYYQFHYRKVKHTPEKYREKIHDVIKSEERN